MSNGSPWRWYGQRALVSFLCIALFIVLLICSVFLVGGLLYVGHEYLEAQEWIESSWMILFIIAFAIGDVICIGFACGFLQQRLWERFGLGCTTCKKEYNWRQYVHRLERGHCPTCLNSGTIPEPALELETVAHEGPASLDNPYAAPSAASYAAASASQAIDFIEPVITEPATESTLSRAIGFALMPLWGALLLGFSPLLLVIMVCSYLNAALGFLRGPHWLRTEFSRKRWNDFIGVLWFYMWILGLTSVAFLAAGSISLMEWSWQNFCWLAWLVCSGTMMFPIVRSWFVKRINPTPTTSPPGNFIVNQDETEHYRLTLHWPAEAKFEQPPTLKFRTVTCHGLVLHVFDRDLKEVIHKQIFPAPSDDDWNELQLPLLEPPVNAFPIERLYFVLDSLDRQPWLVPFAELPQPPQAEALN